MEILRFLGGIVTAGFLAIGSLFSPAPAHPQAAFGSFYPVGGQTYTLSGAGVNSTATSISLNSFKTPDGRALTMSMFGTTGYAVIDPNSPTKIEDITFTGITQNANGTAILTGVSRGLDFVHPYLASTTLALSHSGGSYLILSNSAGFYGQQFLFSDTLGTSTGGLIFSSTTPPRYDFDIPAWTGVDNRTLTSKAYVDSVAISGAPNGDDSTKGIFQRSTGAQAAVSTLLGSTGASLALASNIATSTPTINGNYIPVTRAADSKLSPNFIATSSADIYRFGGSVSIAATSTLSATSSIAANGANPLVLNTATSTFNLGGAVASSSLTVITKTATSTNFTTATPDWILVASTTLTSGVATTTLNIPSVGSDLWIVIMASTTAVSGIQIQFNGDAGTKYGWAGEVANAAQVSKSAQKVIPLTVNDTIDSSAAGAIGYWDIHITNTSDQKFLVANGQKNSANNAPGSYQVWGTYQASTKISSISLGAGLAGALLGVSTRIAVYASAQ